MLNRVEAVVIRTLDYGESHKIVVLLSRQAGKISVMARGARKTRSRLTAVTQMFTYGEYTYFQSAHGQMGTLNDGEILESHHPLRTDLQKSAHAAYYAEMVDRLIGDREGSGFLFSQLLAALQALEQGKDAQIVTHLFELRMLDEAGYSLSLDRCASCGGEADQPILHAASGGSVCSLCSPAIREGLMPLSDKTFRLLQLMQKLDLRKLGNVQVSAGTKEELKRTLRRFMDWHVPVSWKSRAFLEQMEKYEL
jgi:DNA repair protein RecO (recombination protein O)